MNIRWSELTSYLEPCAAPLYPRSAAAADDDDDQDDDEDDDYDNDDADGDGDNDTPQSKSSCQFQAKFGLRRYKAFSHVRFAMVLKGLLLISSLSSS